MTERTHIPGSPACGQWETLLADALDGLLTPQDEATFTAHKAACPACSALYEESRRGLEWLEFLGPEPEVPAGLVEKILAQTGPGHKAAQPVLAGAGAMAMPLPAWQRPGLMGAVRRWAEPRLMMTAAMAFFSIALTLNLSGVRLGDLRHADLRPTAVRSYMERQINMASVPIIRYYDHLRLVYEVQSRVRELRGEDETPQPSQQQPAGTGESKQNHKDGGSRMESPQRSGEPARAQRSYNPGYVETALEAGNKGSREQGTRELGTREQGTREQGTREQGTREQGIREPGNYRMWAAGKTEALQIRAFRRLQNPTKASERSRVWIA